VDDKHKDVGAAGGNDDMQIDKLRRTLYEFAFQHKIKPPRVFSSLFHHPDKPENPKL